MQTITLDVETIASEDAAVLTKLRQTAIEAEPSRNSLKALKDSWDSPEAQAVRINDIMKKHACDPLVAHPIMFGVRLEDGVSIRTFEFFDVVSLTPVLCDRVTAETVWVGFNSENFDLAVILNAYRRAGIEPPPHLPRMNGRRWTGRSYDCMLNSGTSAFGKMVRLDTVCEAFGVTPARSDYNGAPMCSSRVSEAYMAGDTQAIIQHCIDDIAATASLYNRLTFDGTVLPF